MASTLSRLNGNLASLQALADYAISTNDTIDSHQYFFNDEGLEDQW